MMRYPNFTLAEFIDSDTAKKKKIDNIPDFQEVDNINELVSHLLQPIRSAWKKPINITSGFRCQALNKAVGGVATSAHLSGWAADCQPSDMEEFKDFCSFVQQFLRETGIPFDQLIIEKSGKTEWLHIGFKGPNGIQRRQYLTINK